MSISINNAEIKINCASGKNVDSILVKNTKNEEHEFSDVDINLRKEFVDLTSAVISLIQDRCDLGLDGGPRLEDLKSVIIDKTTWITDDVAIVFEVNGKKVVSFFPANWGELSKINAKLKAIASKSIRSPTLRLN